MRIHVGKAGVALVLTVAFSLLVSPTSALAGKLYGSKLEQKAYKEYQSIYKERLTKEMTSSEAREMANDVATMLAEKYKMEPISFAYLVLRVRYNETPPSNYTPPRQR